MSGDIGVQGYPVLMEQWEPITKITDDAGSIEVMLESGARMVISWPTIYTGLDRITHFRRLNDAINF